ncbi:hypothetical protein [Mycolicibacterium peregrinum]|uniref:hypothetical protein n=1 Tax=Mycolicibacterium peregrinum TaxID=43304 RepID=UPI003AAC4D54
MAPDFAPGNEAPYWTRLVAYGTTRPMCSACDPLRWSEIRIERAIGRPCYDETYIPLEILLDAPDLLRAFIPYARAQSGVREELTARTIATVDKLWSRYKREILRQAERRYLDDAS